MKTYFNLFLIGIVMMSLFCSCRDNGSLELDPEETVFVLEEPICYAKDFFPDSDPEEELEGSRSSLDFGSNGMKFSWHEDDQLTVFSANDVKETHNTYQIQTCSGLRASFKGEEFALNPDSRYFAISKSTHTAPAGFSVVNRDNVELTYDGQVQIGNPSGGGLIDPSYTAHLGAYDYMAASAVSSHSSSADFQFDHLGLTLFLVFKFDTSDAQEKVRLTGSTWKRIEIYSDDNDYLNPERTINMRSGLNGSTYTPALNTLDMSMPENYAAPRIALDLRAHADKDCPNKDANGKCQCGVTIEKVDDSLARLRAFIEVPPMDFPQKKRFVFRLYGEKQQNTPDNNHYSTSKDLNYYGIYQRQSSLKAGSAVMMTMVPRPTSRFDLKVRLHLDWQNYASRDLLAPSVSSAPALRSPLTTGIPDPGVFGEDFEAPAYLFAWLCYNDQVQQVKYVDLTKNDDGTTRTPAQIKSLWWDDHDVNEMYVYKGLFNYSFDVDADVEECTVYTVASGLKYYTEAQLTADATAHITEEAVRAKTWDLKYKPNTDPATVMTDDEYHLAMKALWATPYNSDYDAFVGVVRTGQNVNLYHVATKVDIQWNSASKKIWGGHLDNVRRNGILLFQPTKNAQMSESNIANFKKLDFTTDEASRYMGRKVIYIPQPSDGVFMINTTKDDNKDGIENDTPVSRNVPFDMHPVHTSWIKANITVP